MSPRPIRDARSGIEKGNWAPGLLPALCCVVLAGLPLGSLASGATYLITTDGTGDFPTIQEALNAAVDGDSVVLGDGEFMLSRRLEFPGHAIVLRSLSGDPTTCILVSRHSEPNQPIVHFWHRETEATIVEGLTFSDAFNEEGHGGGILCYQSSPTIRHCVFKNNQARFGAGIACWQSTAVIEDCVFEGNSAGIVPYPGWGGGISVAQGHPHISNCTFIGNQAGGSGGGINIAGASATIAGCRIVGGYMEGIYCSDSSVDISNCVITGYRGAGVWCQEGTATIVNSTIACNSAYYPGGGINVGFGAEVRIERCIVWGNCADRDFGNIYVDPAGVADFACCMVDSSGVGGGGSIMGLESGSRADPQFCSPLPCDSAPTDQGEYEISEGSPCSPERSPCGDLIGALPVSCSPPSAEPTTWGGIKAMFRK